MKEFTHLLSCLPAPPDFVFDFDGLLCTPLAPHLRAMEQTPQNPVWHGEGDVLTHTKLVCERLCEMDAFRALGESDRVVLSLAALLHDIGKPRTTKLEDGVLVSPNHGSAGAHIARELLWREFGLCGSEKKQRLREAVCFLVRYHMFPVHALSGENPELRLRRIAVNGDLTPGFTMKLLCLLSRADVLGRIAPDTQELLASVDLCAQFAEECGCYACAPRFAGSAVRAAYLSGRNVLPDQPLYDGTWGEVILLCGLPGTGKDTWIRENHPDMPMVSMDALRAEMGVPATDDQGRVAQAAQEACRVHLRAKQPFVYNTTAVTPLMRGKAVRLFESYGARVRIVYLETGWEEQLRRNASRAAVVPERAIGKMLSSLIPPEASEAQSVVWLCV